MTLERIQIHRYCSEIQNRLDSVLLKVDMKVAYFICLFSNNQD